MERLVLWYEFDFDGKFSHVKLLIKEKYPHTIVMERYRFCCFKLSIFKVRVNKKILLQRIFFQKLDVHECIFKLFFQQ